MELLYSIVIPVYNEADNLIPLVEEVEWVMHAYPHAWELIFVDDGSTDSSQEILQKLVDAKPYIRCISLKKNYGQTSALAAGIRASQGTWVLSLDGDGQNDPRDIPLLIEHSAKYDLVTGIRKKRRDPWHKRLIGKIANRVRSRVLNDRVQDTGCSLKIYRRSCFDKVPLFNGMHRFLPALFQIEGFSTQEVAVHHRERKRGKSKYNLFNRGSSLVDLFAVAWMRKRKLSYEIEREL
ncbi:MAG: glycosyltransferase family 2 protein [Verrucomicrobia bacterium]|nr:glycosyltransferase family 2 protein [Verrucomicrobiota bacterium]MBS0636659.1 glycosyltransferase family 2 protein [Verrucomicrobiota bacterium]